MLDVHFRKFAKWEWLTYTSGQRIFFNKQKKNMFYFDAKDWIEKFTRKEASFKLATFSLFYEEPMYILPVRLHSIALVSSHAEVLRT